MVVVLFRVVLVLFIISLPGSAYCFDSFTAHFSQVDRETVKVKKKQLICVRHQGEINAVKIRNRGESLRVTSFDFLRKKKLKKLKKRLLSKQLSTEDFKVLKRKVRKRFKKKFTKTCNSAEVTRRFINKCRFSSSDPLVLQTNVAAFVTQDFPAYFCDNPEIGIKTQSRFGRLTVTSENLTYLAGPDVTTEVLQLEICSNSNCDQKDLQIQILPGAAQLESPTFFTWGNYSVPDRTDNAARMVWAANNYGHSKRPKGKTYFDIRPVKEVADKAIEGLWALPANQRSLFFFYFGSAQIDGEKLLTTFTSSREDTREISAKYVQWYTEFWQLLKDQDLSPNFVVLDYEDGVSFWHVRSRDVQRLNSRTGKDEFVTGYNFAQYDPQGFNLYLDKIRSWNLEPRLNALSAKDFEFHAKNRNQNVLLLNQAANRIRTVLINEIIFDTYQQVYGVPVAGSNYSHAMVSPEFPKVDKNNWKAPVGTDFGLTPGNWSSPVTYLGIEGNRYRNITPFKDFATADKRLLSWLDQRNEVRSALAVNNLVSPWYSNPDYNLEDRSLWRQWRAGLVEDRKCGVSVFLIWAASFTAEEKVYLHDTVKLVKGTPVGNCSQNKADLGEAKQLIADGP